MEVNNIVLPGSADPENNQEEAQGNHIHGQHRTQHDRGNKVRAWSAVTVGSRPQLSALIAMTAAVPIALA